MVVEWGGLSAVGWDRGGLAVSAVISSPREGARLYTIYPSDTREPMDMHALVRLRAGRQHLPMTRWGSWRSKRTAGR